MKKIYLSLFILVVFGIYSCSDSTTNNSSSQSTWKKVLNDHHVISLYSSGNLIYAGTSNRGIYISTNDGINWNDVNNQIPDTNNVQAISAFGNYIYASTSSYIYGDYSSKMLSTYDIIRTSDNGNNWTAVASGLDLEQPIAAFAICNNTLYATTGNLFFGGITGQVWGIFATSTGSNWYLTYQCNQSQVYGLISYDSIVVAGIYGAVVLSTNNGSSWQIYNNGIPSNRRVTSFAKIGNNLFAGTLESYGGGVFKSTDNGLNWISVNNSLPNSSVYALLSYNNNLFAGCLGGLFMSSNNGTNWIDKSSDLQNKNIYSLLISNNIIFVGTYSSLFYKSINDLLNN